eukprot:TRINITY_DN1700_c0_g1_i1.p1 TRINITY_DN1700_c0_g1~~TRINITY_DN1700_c0_g1_i1.p1  ORF type:complete len:243 (+),score=42.46 TRINITY_DN1700_c0_g1_i1:572-1300(+)
MKRFNNDDPNSQSTKRYNSIKDSAQSCKHDFEGHHSRPSRASVQKPAPSFTAQAVVDGEFKQINYPQDYSGKYSILLFYPLDFTFVCPTELIAFSERIQEFRALNTEVVAVSIDSKHSHLAFSNLPREKGGLGKTNLPLVADITKSISRSYNVLIDDGEDAGIALRGLFIVDGKGILRQITVNDLPVGRSVDETLRLVEAFQHADEHGEVCPAGWKKGDRTLKDNPFSEETIDYFQNVMAKK